MVRARFQDMSSLLSTNLRTEEMILSSIRQYWSRPVARQTPKLCSIFGCCLCAIDEVHLEG